MAADKPARRPKAETPRGFRDYFGAEVTERQEMLATIAEVYRMHGFDPLETSAVETVEALGKFLPDVDRPNEGVFGWQDEDGYLYIADRRTGFDPDVDLGTERSGGTRGQCERVAVI